MFIGLALMLHSLIEILSEADYDLIAYDELMLKVWLTMWIGWNISYVGFVKHQLRLNAHRVDQESIQARGFVAAELNEVDISDLRAGEKMINPRSIFAPSGQPVRASLGSFLRIIGGFLCDLPSCFLCGRCRGKDSSALPCPALPCSAPTRPAQPSPGRSYQSLQTLEA